MGETWDWTLDDQGRFYLMEMLKLIDKILAIFEKL